MTRDLVEWLLIMGVIVLMFATPWIADLFRHFGDRGVDRRRILFRLRVL